MPSGADETMVTEQTCGRDNISKARKDKSLDGRDVVAAMETRVAKLELAVGDSGEHLDVLEQSLEQEVEGLKGEIKELHDDMLSTINSVVHDSQVANDSFQAEVLKMLESFEARLEEVQQDVAMCKKAIAGGTMLGTSKVEVPKPKPFDGKRDVKGVDNYLWHMERYFEAMVVTEEDAKVDGPMCKLLLKKDKAHDMDINSVQWSYSDNRMLASASDDGTVKIWELTSLP